MFINRSFLLGIILALGLSAHAQTPEPDSVKPFIGKKFHIGYSVGFNTAWFRVVSKPDWIISIREYPGFHLNLIANYRVNNSISLRFLPGIQLNQRDITALSLLSPDTDTWKIESTFVTLPVQMKYTLNRIKKMAPYLIGGIGPRFDLTGLNNARTWQKSVRVLKPFDIYPELGIGSDFFLKKTKIAVEIKICFGLLNVFQDQLDEMGQLTSEFYMYDSSIRKIYSRIFALSFQIE